tara:strand:+ start:284 stop:532 length:249 start_codon:yes stop_codon:yes gene_type:complete
MAQVSIESRIIEWEPDDGSSKTITFNSVFEGLPVVNVIAAIRGSEPADLNTYISQVSKTQVVIETSAHFSGSIHMQAVYKTW